MMRIFASGLLIFALAAPASVRACATCFGASDSDLARGMNWGIFSLLMVVVGVLSGFATFFVYIARRSATVAARSAVRASTETITDAS